MTEKYKTIEPFDPPIFAPCKVCFELDDADIISKTTLETGYLTRGFEKSCENISLLKIPHILGQVDCKFTYSTSLASIILLEKIFDVETSDYAQIVRTLLLEIGRSIYFLNKAAKILNLIDAQIFASQIRKFSLVLENHVLKNIKHKSLLFYWRIGGVKNTLSDDFCPEFMVVADQINQQLSELTDLILLNPQVKSLFRNNGKISQQEAIKYGLSGLALRSTGVKLDARKSEDYLKYSQLDFEACSDVTGDSLARLNLTFQEIFLSLKLARQLCSKFKDYRALTVIDPKISGTLDTKNADTFEFVKGLEFLRNTAPFVISGDYSQDFEIEEGILRLFMRIVDGHLQNFHVSTPSRGNIFGFEKACLSHKIEDITLILSTFDISFGQVDK